MVKQFRSGTCFSYLVYEPSASAAILIDPCRELVSEYKELIAELKITHVMAVDTHHCLEHASASSLFHSESFVPVGSVDLCLLPVPQSAGDSICLLGAGMVFTGDLLNLGAESPEDWQRKEAVFAGVSGDVLLFPAQDQGDLLFSRLDEERSKKPSHSRRTLSLGVEKYKAHLQSKKEGSIFLDVREEVEYRQGHIPGTINLPLSMLGNRLHELNPEHRIYISCQSGRRSERVAKTLAHLGFTHIVDITGGFQAWKAAGNPIE